MDKTWSMPTNLTGSYEMVHFVQFPLPRGFGSSAASTFEPYGYVGASASRDVSTQSWLAPVGCECGSGIFYGDPATRPERKSFPID